MIGWKHTLIWNWRSAYKWASIQFVAVGAAVQIALLAFPDEMRSFLPDWMTHGIALFCFAAAAYGRVTTREPDGGVAKTQESLDVHKSNQ